MSSQKLRSIPIMSVPTYNPYKQVGATLVIRHQHVDKTSLETPNVVISRNGIKVLSNFSH